MKIRTLLPALLVLSIVLPVIAQEEPGKQEEEGPSLRTLKTDLRQAILAEDTQAIEETLFQYRAKGGRKAIGSLIAFLRKIPLNLNKSYWQVVNGIAAFDDDEALRELGDSIIENKSKALARDLMFGLRNNRSTRVIAVHTTILKRGTADLQQMAVDQLTDIRVVESVDAIIEALRGKTLKSEVKWWAARALEIMTGANLGQDGDRWHEWWQHARKKGLPKQDDDAKSGMVTDNLDPLRKYEFQILKKMPMGQVMVLNTQCPQGGCNFDAIEDILERMDIPHTVVKREDFEKTSTSLKGVMAIVVNCTQIKKHCICPTCKPGGTKTNRLYRCTDCNKHQEIKHGLTRKGINKIKAFVEAGGNLFTEDWVLKEVLEKAWPKYVSSGKYLRQQEVDIAPARGRTSHPLMRGVFIDPIDIPPEEEGKTEKDGDKPEGRKTKGRRTITEEDEEEIVRRIRTLNHQWLIDDESPYLQINNKRAVVKLLESEKVGKLSKGNDAVAVTFFTRKRALGSAGGGGERRPSGRVLHVLSHFGRQSSEEDEFAMQNLLLNFLLEANRFYHEGKKKKAA